MEEASGWAPASRTISRWQPACATSTRGGCSFQLTWDRSLWMTSRARCNDRRFPRSGPDRRSGIPEQPALLDDLRHHLRYVSLPGVLSSPDHGEDIAREHRGVDARPGFDRDD